jgi:tetratricopeptide (TPR) repeat protein
LWDSSRKPSAGNSNGNGNGTGAGGGRGGRPVGQGGRPTGGRSDDKLWTRGGRPARGDRDARDHAYELSEEEKRARELRSVRPRHDDPDLPADVEARQLAKEARVELKTLSKDNADWVAQHLVMASRLIDADPELAHRHALSASRRAGRIGVVRETLAITAYATGDFALALRELRTYRRITGSNDQIALMVDSERGVGRPDRALELGRSVDRTSLPTDVQVSLAIAMSGARLDLGQDEAALAELEIPQLDPNRAFSWSPDLFHAYAEVLEALGRDDDAATWRERAERAELALEEAHADAELETIHIVEEDVELQPVEVSGDDSSESADHAEADDEGEQEGEPGDGAVSTDE